MASATDKFKRSSDTGEIPVVATIQTPRAAGVSTFNVDTQLNWSTTTGIAFSTYKVDANNKKIDGTQVDWEGVSDGVNTISAAARTGGATDTGSAVNDKVEMIITAQWARDLIDGILTGHNQDGSHKALTLPSATITGNASVGGDLSVAGNETITGLLTPNGGIANNKVSPLAMKKPIKGRFYRGGDAVHAGTVWYVNNMDSADYNFGGYVIDASGGIKVPYAGVYDVTGVNAYQDGPADSDILVGFNVNSAGGPAGPWVRGGKHLSAQTIALTMTRSFVLAANDILYLYEYFGSTANYRLKGTNGGDCSWLEIEYRGPSS